jgi:hypothetical protein
VDDGVVGVALVDGRGGTCTGSAVTRDGAGAAATASVEPMDQSAGPSTVSMERRVT